MSLADTPAYAELSDVQAAMQETDQAFAETPLSDTNVEPAIQTASRWLRRQSGGHWYDSGGTASDLIDTNPATASGIRMDIPSSPHAQSGQLFTSSKGVHRVRQYPVTQAGQYARATTSAGKPRLPKRHVENIDALNVRELGGETTDWVADTSKDEGRGEDYYLQVDGADDGGRSYLYLHAGSIGARRDFADLLTVDVTFGLDWQDTPWADVRRGVAHLAAAELVKDDDVLTAIPDGAAIGNVQTEVDLHLRYAFDQPGYLAPYVEVQVA